MHLWRKHATNDWLREHAEALIARYGNAVAIVEQPGKRALVEVAIETQREAIHLQQEFAGRIEKLPADWLRRIAAQTPSKPLRIGSRLVVSHTKGPNTIVIPAEAAFGTGDHATTALCLRMLERLTRTCSPGWSMLDAGTGSGILAIAGSRFGAGRIIAVDNDPLACSTAKRNARVNETANIEFRTGDVLKARFRGQFDVITANLFSELLIAALPNWMRHFAINGRLILSGVLRSQERSLMMALRQNGCAPAEIKRRGKWIAVLAARTRKRS